MCVCVTESEECVCVCVKSESECVRVCDCESEECVCLCLCVSVCVVISVWIVFRIQYCSQEMVVIREDLVNKMCRNCVRLPSSNLDIPSHVSQSFIYTVCVCEECVCVQARERSDF